MRRSGVSGCTSVAVAESVAAAESVECAASSRTFPGRRNFQEEGKRGKTGVCQTVRVCVAHKGTHKSCEENWASGDSTHGHEMAWEKIVCSKQNEKRELISDMWGKRGAT